MPLVCVVHSRIRSHVSDLPSRSVVQTLFARLVQPFIHRSLVPFVSASCVCSVFVRACNRYPQVGSHITRQGGLKKRDAKGWGEKILTLPNFQGKRVIYSSSFSSSSVPNFAFALSYILSLFSSVGFTPVRISAFANKLLFFSHQSLNVGKFANLSAIA